MSGLARNLAGAGAAAPTRFDLREADFTIAMDGSAPIVASYRDLTTIAVDQGRLLLIIGDGALRIIAEQLGAGLGTLVRDCRERRARQQLSDRFIELPDSERLELVEYRAGDEHGVAQVAYHAWGMALLPVDDRQPWRLVRRADVTEVRAAQSSGSVAVTARETAFELVALGAHFERHRARIDSLRQAALADAGAIVGRLMPAAPFADRQLAASLLVDGRPVSPAELGESWPAVERAVLSDPTYAQTFQTLVQRGGPDALRWLALAPRRPTDPAEHNAWFLVGLPGGLLAMELVSEGSHATYLFRARDSLDEAVREISDFLIDARFLREPIYMTDADLAAPEHLRYQFAIAALPSLRAARARFLRRLIHTDEEAWAAGLDEAITTEGA